MSCSEDEPSVIVHLPDTDSQSNHNFSKLFHNFPRQQLNFRFCMKSLQNPVMFEKSGCVQRLTTAMLHSTNLKCGWFQLKAAT